MSVTNENTYQVLARKYRPATFADLIGQDAMVRTLHNAFAADRIAQAFILTGIRGTGKTTTARIIAKGMNCVGPAGDGGPTTEPCGQCENCLAISAGRHVDVLEMDAASHTSVNDIREIIDGVNYRAASARYKIYIIDEVHMLSNAAFNALLKTLEEPPAHVKFIFATTEIRKVPVTVLSRCQRFDLRRIEAEVMIAHLSSIAQKEGSEIDDEALGLITRAAEGSVRDALSLLDQALAQGETTVTGAHIRAMLGLADRGRVMDLFDLVMRGDAAGALDELSGQYADGADPAAVLRDLAELTHWISVVKITPDAAEDPTIAPAERDRGRIFAETLAMRHLTRLWQMLLKALEELNQAPNAMMAAEMAIIRLTHVADLPAPADLVRKLQNNPPTQQSMSTPSTTPAPAPAAPQGNMPATTNSLQATSVSARQVALAQAPAAETMLCPSFGHVIELIRHKRDAKLLIEVENGVRLVQYRHGFIEFEPAPSAPANLASELQSKLSRWTGTRWAISVVDTGGAPSVSESKHAEQDALHQKIRVHPLAEAVFRQFPSAKFAEIRTFEQIAKAAQQQALPEVEEEWDPFEED